MEKKTIYDLLSNYHFVVPEIQREYVWGNSKNKNILIQFLRDLNDKICKGEANIGFLYSYQSGVEHYLIDGQQRYTTMLLFLYYLSLKDNTIAYSDFLRLQRLDSNMPAFSYRVRTHTESFLVHLLKSKARNSKMVKDQIWFKSEYSTDSTIDSMLGALDIFEELSLELTNLTYEIVMTKVCFWYFDVAQTSQGEELYITMNSRGEKLTDSEQIKPRLLNKVKDVWNKEVFGKKWDDWEELFFNKSLRGERKVESIDNAMNNVVRIVLELTTQGEHDHIKPVEDAESITLYDIELYMNAIKFLLELSNDEYKAEVERLYGDKDSDGNFYVLKVLLTEIIKGQKDNFEYERVYQTIANQVRRNKIKKHTDYLYFLAKYRESPQSFYEFILNSSDERINSIITGHELEKLKLCSDAHDRLVEEAIWGEQSSNFWDGEIKALIEWSKVKGKFFFTEFERISCNFHKLFNENADWTSDSVRQALITCRMPCYPYNEKFGYYPNEWKEIFEANSREFLTFLNHFDKIEGEGVELILKKMKETYPESPDNSWAEFVHHNYLLGYCDTKHLYWTDDYGWLLVQRSWAKPISVKNMRLFHDLKKYYGSEKINEWIFQKNIAWNSSIFMQNTETKVYVDMRYLRKSDNNYLLRVDLSREDVSADEQSFLRQELAKYIPSNIEMQWDEEYKLYTIIVDSIDILYVILSHCLQCNSKNDKE